FQAMLPQALKADYQKLLHRLTEAALPEPLETVFAGRDQLDFTELEERGLPLAPVKQAIADGDLEIIYQVKRKDNYKKLMMLKRIGSIDELDEYVANLSNRAKKQRILAEFLTQLDEPILLKSFLTKMKTTRATVQ